MNKRVGNILKILLFFGVGLTILYLVYTNQNEAWQEDCALKGVADCPSLLDKVIADFGTVNWFWILLVLLAFTISNVSRSLRWEMLLQPLGYHTRFINRFFTIMLGYFANLGFPRIGEVVRAGSFGSYEKIPTEKVMGTVIVSRIMDLLCMLVLLGLTFLLEFDRISGFLTGNMNTTAEAENGGNGSWLAIGVAAVLVVSVVLFWFFRKAIMAHRFTQKIVTVLKGLLEGIQTVRKLDRPGLFIFHSINIWVMYFFMTYLAFFAFPPTAHLAPSAGLIIFSAGALGILIPTPGGMGTYHAIVTAALVSLYGIQEASAFSFSNILFFSVQIGANVLLGVISLIILPLYNRNYSPPNRKGRALVEA